MKIYTVNGRRVWLDKAPEAKAEPEKKARKTTSNKARKAGANK